MKIILGSASPRRRELLAQIGLEFEVLVSDVEEKVTAEAPCEMVRELALRKAEAVLSAFLKDCGKKGESGVKAAGLGDGLLVIGADTIVACGDTVLGKPSDGEDAARMLRLLSGRSHEVYTGVAMLYHEGDAPVSARVFHEAATVHFAPMSEAEIQEYVATGDPLDKAGAYGIQGFCARYITGIEGDYNNVVGLPVCRLYQEAKGWIHGIS